MEQGGQGGCQEPDCWHHVGFSQGEATWVRKGGKADKGRLTAGWEEEKEARKEKL